ncbi:MAG: hypothetical protein Q9176_001815 [Flavoplaca citrina]
MGARTNLDFWQTLLGVFWLRRSNPTVSPQTTDMDEICGVMISLFPKKGKQSIAVRADVDRNIPFSIVQKSLLEDWQLLYESCQDPQFTDKRGRTHTPIGYVDLQWHKAGSLLENSETFYVVDSGDPIVELKHGGEQPADSGIRPVALGPQTPDTQAQKKARVEKERAEEKKRQEQRDREKQQGQ